MKVYLINISVRVGTLVAIVALFASPLLAQPDAGALFEPVTDTPINAGIAMMAAAGIGYGFKMLNKRKK